MQIKGKPTNKKPPKFPHSVNKYNKFPSKYTLTSNTKVRSEVTYNKVQYMLQLNRKGNG